MSVYYDGYLYDENFIEKFNNSCDRVNAFEFNSALNKRNQSTSIIKFLSQIYKDLDFCDVRREQTLLMNLEECLSMVVDFYSQINTNLGDSVDNILHGKNKLFNVHYYTNPKNKNFGLNNVGSRGNDLKLTFNVSFGGTLRSLRTLVHECAHALNSLITQGVYLRNQISLEPDINKKESLEKEEREFYITTHQWNYDCIGETESLIAEKLFNLYLLNNGIITEEEYEESLDADRNSLIHNLSLILEENKILSALKNKPLTPHTFENFEKEIRGTRFYKPLMSRFKTIAERQPRSGEYSLYKFRYVVGEIISTLWMDRFINSSTANRQKMKDEFVKFLSISYNLNINETCSHLLHQDVESCANEFLFLITKTKEVQK